MKTITSFFTIAFMRWVNPEKRLGRFVNPYVEEPKHNIWDVILWRFGHYDEPHHLPEASFRYPSIPNSCDREKSHAVWLGHSTFIIRVGEITLLTDPLFSDHCSPIPIHSLKRRNSLPMTIDELPPIDIVLLSHNHYDHLDENSVRQIHRRYPRIHWIVPMGVKKWFYKRSIEHVSEMNWGETVQYRDVRIHAVPAQHFSGRGLWDENRSLWCGYVTECASKIFYFVGDSGYNSVDFKKIGELWPNIDLSMIPIGAYAPKRLLKSIHVSPDEAVQIHCDVKSRLSLGMHWNTFCLSDEPMELPPYDLYLAMKERNLPFETFLPIDLGTYVNW